MTTSFNIPAQKMEAADVDVLKVCYMMIAQAAYFRAEKRAFAPGNEIADWLSAEAEIDAAMGRPATSTADLRQCVRDLVTGEEADISGRIRLLAVRALAFGLLDAKALKSVVSEIVCGAEEGASQLGDRGKDILRDTVSGLERALSDVAEAGKLAVEEARGRATSFSNDELRKAIEELQVLKTLLGESLRESASNTSVFVQSAVQGLADHVRIQTAQLSQEVDDLLGNLGDHMLMTVRQRRQAGRQALKEQKGALVGLTTAALRSIAERLERANTDPKT